MERHQHVWEPGNHPPRLFTVALRSFEHCSEMMIENALLNLARNWLLGYLSSQIRLGFTHFLRRKTNRGVQDVYSLCNLQRHQSNCEDAKEKIRISKKKLKRISHYPICKMKPSCDKETAYLLTYPFGVYIIRINQSECLPLLSIRRINQSIFTTFESQYPFVALLLLTCDTCVMYLWLTCDPLVALFWPTYDYLVIYL